MKPTSSIARILRGTALAVLIAGLGVWTATGAHVGWTQTSAVQIQRDDITGIDYPVRRAAFVAGVEVPLLAALAAAVLTTASFATRRVSRVSTVSTTQLS